MQELFIYLLKSSGLIAAFFLSYHFLLRKETFFTSNRWFLLAGLITSVALPLYFIKKIVFVERPKITTADLVALSNNSNSNATQTVPTLVESIDWMQVVAFGYVVVVLILVLKILFNVLSLFKLLHNQTIEKQETFAIVDLQENIAPFSFFNFIVFNSSLYTQNEMESILLHEKVHSKQKHSFDVLLVKLFCVLFWFNPFIWLYKKAIIQNLEYIADSEAIQLIEDKKVYQKALLKVVTHQNCLSITNPFYQSLIKKRIVMLNKNQS
ncbi:MAG: M56 family metallopeptidase, partial [Bacteroidota bacterium]